MKLPHVHFHRLVHRSLLRVVLRCRCGHEKTRWVVLSLDDCD